MDPILERYQALEDKIKEYNPALDAQRLFRAFTYADNAHAGQLRKDGSPYIIHPLAVDEMHNLMARCYLIMTDSGGLQEEAPSLGKPVLVLRRETERPEAIEAGTVKLAGVEQANIVKLARELFDDEDAYAKMAHAVNPYGDGKTSQRIVQAIEQYFGLREDGPAPFNP